MFSGSMRLLVFTPGTAFTPMISDTIARANLTPRPPFGPVLSHTPKTRQCGAYLSSGVANAAASRSSSLPIAESRNSTAFLPSSRVLSRRMASTMRCGACKDVIFGTPGFCTFEKSTAVTGSWMTPSSASCRASSMRLAWLGTLSSSTHGSFCPPMMRSSVAYLPPS